MKKNIFNIALFSLVLSAFTVSCSEPDDEITTGIFDRLFSPTNVEAILQKRTNVKFKWVAVANAKSYTIELYENQNMTFEGTPKVYDGITDNTYTVEGLLGETQYTARIKAVSPEIDESKWYAVAFMTEAENIFNSVKNEDIEAHAVTLTWDAINAAVTKIIFSAEGLNDKEYQLTATDIAQKKAHVDQLEESTSYTAKLYNGDKLRGTVTFKTAIDFDGKTPVYEGDDLKTILTDAADGDNIVLVTGSFTLGDFEVDKSLIISGYDKTNMPTIYGRLLPAAGVSSLEINNLIFRGDVPEAEANTSNFIEFQSGATISTLTVNGCEIRNYTNQVIYSSASVTLGTVLFNNCWSDKIIGSGGDSFDFRNGTLGTLTIQNSTFSNGGRTFIRCNVTSATINVTNCTFYKVCNYDNSNNSGLFLMDKVSASSGNLTVQKCVFSNIGVAALGYWAKAGKMKATTSYSKNFYYSSPHLWDATNGFYKDPSACNATEVDPKFANPDSGDFTVGSDDIKDAQAGDPRWIK